MARGVTITHRSEAAEAEQGRSLSRHETHDLSMIIKDRAKVLKAHAEEQAAACLADFESKVSTVYKFDQEEVWRKAAEAAERVVADSRKMISDRCKEIGIPASFAPTLELSWRGRGENMMASRRAELRLVAKTTIEAMTRAAITKIEKQSLELRTQVVARGLLSAEAKLFLESLAPIEDAMHSLDFADMERKLELEKQRRGSEQRYLGYS